MHKHLLKNIGTIWSVYENAPGKLAGEQMSEVPFIKNAWLACENGLIVDFGAMGEFPGITDWKDLEVTDCTGKDLFPSFADCHTHLVYAGNRVQEFEYRLKGHSYEEIAAMGGGIINSALKLRLCTEDQLFSESLPRFKEIILQGTGAVEIKSGYGLDIESELKMLRVIRRLKDLGLVPVKATFLGAHAVPPEFKNNREGYVDHLITDMLPAIAEEKLADYIDVFCEKNYFTAAETRKILEAGRKYGLLGKVHAEQLSNSGGIHAGVQEGAVSVDHLEFCTDEDIKTLLGSETMPTILPGAAFFLDLPRPPAKKMIDAGLPLAIASDYNPGSSPSGNMKLMMSLACIQYKLTPGQAFNAATLNSAWAMGLVGEVGCIARGMAAGFFLSGSGGGPASLTYRFGSDQVDAVYAAGKKITD